jgi:hypothetical protein
MKRAGDISAFVWSSKEFSERRCVRPPGTLMGALHYCAVVATKVLVD